MDPWLLGWPVRRPRKYTIMVLRSAYEWTGSASEYESIFERQVDIKASEPFCAPEEELNHTWMEAARRSSKIPSDGSDIDPMKLLTPAQRRRAQDYKDTWKFGDDIYADVLQETSFCSAGPFIPPLLKNTVLYSTALGRPALAKEHLVMQGIPAFDFLATCSPDNAWPSLLEKQDFGNFTTRLLNDRQIKHLACNAMYKPSVGSVVLCAFSRALTKARFEIRFHHLASSFDFDVGCHDLPDDEEGGKKEEQQKGEEDTAPDIE